MKNKTVPVTLLLPEDVKLNELLKMLSSAGYRAKIKLVAKRKANPERLLNPASMGLLLLTSYEKPRRCVGSEGLAADRMVRLGLLEEDPTNPTWYRRTERGNKYLQGIYQQYRK